MQIAVVQAQGALAARRERCRSCASRAWGTQKPGRPQRPHNRYLLAGSAIRSSKQRDSLLVSSASTRRRSASTPTAWRCTCRDPVRLLVVAEAAAACGGVLLG